MTKFKLQEYVKSLLRQNSVFGPIYAYIRDIVIVKWRNPKIFKRVVFCRKMRNLVHYLDRNDMTKCYMLKGHNLFVGTEDGLWLYYNYSIRDRTLGDGLNRDFKASPGPYLAERILHEALRHESTYLDVGANNGYFYALKIANKHSSSRIYCFEPDRRILNHLVQNIRVNNLGNIEVIPVGLTDRVGTARFTEGRDASSFLTHDEAPDFFTVEVECTTLDHFVETRGIDRVDAIKVDIEGGEFAFLQGANRVISTYRPTLIIELNDRLLRRAGTSIGDVFKYFRKHKYLCYRLVGSNDYVAVPEDRVAFIDRFSAELSKEL